MIAKRDDTNTAKLQVTALRRVLRRDAHDLAFSFRWWVRSAEHVADAGTADAARSVVHTGREELVDNMRDVPRHARAAAHEVRAAAREVRAAAQCVRRSVGERDMHDCLQSIMQQRTLETLLVHGSLARMRDVLSRWRVGTRRTRCAASPSTIDMMQTTLQMSRRYRQQLLEHIVNHARTTRLRYRFSEWKVCCTEKDEVYWELLSLNSFLRLENRELVAQLKDSKINEAVLHFRVLQCRG